MIGEPLPFAPTPGVLAAVLDEVDRLGPDGGGAVEPGVRRAALDAFERQRLRRTPMPPNWRHDYAALTFDDLIWQTGRMPAPSGAAAPPRRNRAESGERLARSSAAEVRDPSNPHDADDASDVPPLAVENAGGLVHVGGVYLEAAERTGDPRITLESLADACRRDARAMRAVHQRIVTPGTDRFAALATAFQNCGAFVDIPAGVALGAPVQLLWMSRPGEANAVFPHTVVRLGEGARATIVERHTGDTDTFVCGIVEAELGPGARLDYVVIQEADEASRLFVRRAARCAAGAAIGWHIAELGATLVRSVVNVRLVAASARAQTNAFFFASGFKHVDLSVDVAHRARETESRTIVRSAASERGQGRMSASVGVAHEARFSRAEMRSDGLILSHDAYLGAAPKLDILANDVSVTNAATTGSLDGDALFYVQSRGIAPRDAERMIALAFFESAIAGFPAEPLRDEVRSALDMQLDRIPDAFRSS